MSKRGRVVFLKHRSAVLPYNLPAYIGSGSHYDLSITPHNPPATHLLYREGN